MVPGASIGAVAPMADRPTILFVTDYYYGTHGGTEGQLLELLRHLPALGYAPRLVVLRDTAFTRELADFCCPVQTLGIRRILSLITLWKLIRFFYQLRGERVPLVHVYFNDASLMIPPFAWLAGSKVIVSRRDMGIWYTRLNLWALRWVGQFVDRVIANSQGVARQVEVCEWLPRDRIRIVCNGYAFDRDGAPPLAGFRAQHRIGPTDPIVGIVANLSSVKRHADLLKAFVEVRRRQPSAHLVLLGTGPLLDSLKQQVTASDLTDCVHFLGSVSDVIPVVKHFSVGVLCSESEGFSNALIEYMACGVPPVCTRTGGNVELVADGNNGFLVEVGDISALAERILQLMSDRELANRIGGAAQRYVGQYTVARMLAGTTDVYHELLELRVVT